MSASEPSAEPTQDTPLVFFDGDCGLCHAFVRWVIQRDVEEVFWFAPLDGETARRLRATEPTWPEDLDSIIIWTPSHPVGARAAWYSDGVFMVLAKLPNPWPWLGVFRVVPRPIRDGVYRGIARLRYRLFGRKDLCTLSAHGAVTRLLP